MEWQQRSSSAIDLEFSALNETNDVFSNVIAIYLEETPVDFPITITGASTCPGCRGRYPWRIEAFKSFAASCRITCTNSQCGDEYDVYAAYRPGESGWDDDPPIYLYAQMYTTLKGQFLTPIILEVEDLNIG